MGKLALDPNGPRIESLRQFCDDQAKRKHVRVYLGLVPTPEPSPIYRYLVEFIRAQLLKRPMCLDEETTRRMNLIRRTNATMAQIVYPEEQEQRA